MRNLEFATRIACANISDEKSYNFGAIGVRTDGAIVTSTNVRTQKPHHHAHCEVRLLKKCDLGATIYIVRVTKDGAWANAKPCIKCQTLIKNKGVKRVYYSLGEREYAVWEP
jgi:tRNA(Arg) A34 adenosine deaminase TadA